MTVQTTQNSVSYTGDGVSVTFAVPFYFLLATDLVVSVAGVTQAYGSAYTVSGAGVQAGGSVTFAAAPASGATVVVTRVPPLTQLVAPVNNQTTLAETLADVFDKACMVDQWLETQILNEAAGLAAEVTRAKEAESVLSAGLSAALAATASSPILGIFNVKQFGAVGDGSSHPISGITDLPGNISTSNWSLAQWQAYCPDVVALTDEMDWVAAQAAIRAASAAGGGMVLSPGGVYLQNRPIVIENYAAANPSTNYPENAIHAPTNLRTIFFGSYAQATWRATAVMQQQLLWSYNSTLNAIAPYYGETYGIIFDGNSLAVYNAYSTWCAHNVWRKNVFKNPSSAGLGKDGSGNHIIDDNQFLNCSTCINFVAFGDDTVTNNGFWPLSGGSGIEFQTSVDYDGNTLIAGNVFNRDTLAQGLGTINGVLIDATANSAKTIRDVRIVSNEFQGMTTSVSIVGASNNNVFNITIADNHTIPCGYFNNGGVANDTTGTPIDPGNLVYASHAVALNIHGNYVGSNGNTSTTNALTILNCENVNIQGNHFIGVGAQVLYAQTLQSGVITGNTFLNCGAAGGALIQLDTSSTLNIVSCNSIKQWSAYTQTFLSETGSSDYTKAFGNIGQSAGTLTMYALSGAHSASGSAAV